MTRTTNARIAGISFLLYIMFGIAAMVLSGRATGGEGILAKLAGIAAHPSEMRFAALLTLFTCFTAISLGVTLYALTRDQDHDLAMLGLSCRVAEGVIAAISVEKTVGLVRLATATGADAPTPEAAAALGSWLISGSMPVTASFFAVGSTIFCWLFLRGRMIPSLLAWIGLVASLLLVVVLPLQLAGVVEGAVTQYVWLPMALFEIPVAFWLIFKGARAPVRMRAL